MPFIDCKITKKLNEDQKITLKSKLGKAITAMNKTESYLMVGIDDGYDLFFGGRKVDSGAYVAISVFGSVNPSCAEKMTKAVCTVLSEDFSLDPAQIYVTYRGVSEWGWNGSNF